MNITALSDLNWCNKQHEEPIVTLTLPVFQRVTITTTKDLTNKPNNRSVTESPDTKKNVSHFTASVLQALTNQDIQTTRICFPPQQGQNILQLCSSEQTVLTTNLSFREPRRNNTTCKEMFLTSYTVFTD